MRYRPSSTPFTFCRARARQKTKFVSGSILRWAGRPRPPPTQQQQQRDCQRDCQQQQHNNNNNMLSFGSHSRGGVVRAFLWARGKNGLEKHFASTFYGYSEWRKRRQSACSAPHGAEGGLLFLFRTRSSCYIVRDASTGAPRWATNAICIVLRAPSPPFETGTFVVLSGSG